MFWEELKSKYKRRAKRSIRNKLTDNDDFMSQIVTQKISTSIDFDKYQLKPLIRRCRNHSLWFIVIHYEGFFPGSGLLRKQTLSMILKLCLLVKMKTVFFASECVELCDVTTVHFGHSRLVRKLSQVPYHPHETFSNIDVQFSGVVNFSRLSPYQSNTLHEILFTSFSSKD